MTKLDYETLPDCGANFSYGSLPLASLVDDIASQTPLRPFSFVPRSDNPKDGWKPVSFKLIANAINYVAHRMTEDLKPSPHRNGTFPTLAYIGPNDLRYFIFMMACVKTGNQAFFVSPRNSIEGQLSLFKAADCKVLCYASSHRTMVQPWLQENDMQAFEVSGIETWLESGSPPFPYSKTAKEAEWDPLVVLHSSGSTGHPKPIVVRQASIHAAATLGDLHELNGVESFFLAWAKGPSRILMPMPLFHAAGVFLITTMTVYYNVQFALPLPDRPLSSDSMMQYLEYAVVDAVIMPPALIEDLSSTEPGVQALKRMKFVAFGGGKYSDLMKLVSRNLSAAIGNMLMEHGVVLQSMISSTEYYPYLLYFNKNPKLWQYFIFNSKAMGIEWRPAANEDDIYEMVIVRKDPKHPGIQTVFYTFPDATEYATKDLYKPHPSLPDHWMWCGRADDIIVFSNGEKLNPITFEGMIMAHSGIKGAIVVGQERFQPALLLEPVTQPADQDAAKRFIDEMWPTIERANQETVAHGRITRGFVALASPEKPFLRAGKGTVQRAPTIKLYKSEIDLLYDEAGAQEDGAVELDLSSCEALTQSIVHLFHTRLHSAPLEPEDVFFSVGIDSLQVITAAKLLRNGLQTAGIAIEPATVTPRIIYQHATAKQLATYLYSVVKGGLYGLDGNKQDVDAAEKLLKKYTEDLPTARPDKQDPLNDDQTILLTGTTGSLGAYILDILISSPRVKKIIALNRGVDGGLSRQPGVSSERGLNTDFQKVEFLRADLSQPHLGIGEARYDRLLDEADRIIHNAWPVNFNINITSFAPHILGVRRLADFSAAAAKRVPVVFISSIGTVDGWKGPQSVPERALTDLSLPTMSYGRSKLVGSLILDAAAEASGIPVVSVRVGQIAGPRGEKGMWNKQEFMPSLIASSVYLGVLPNNLRAQETVDWVPIEDMASLILEVAGVTTNVPVAEISGYFHAINPSVTSWGKVARVLAEFYAGRINKMVSLEQWVKALEASAGSTDDIASNPAIKLLDTYRGMLAGAETGDTGSVLEVVRTKDRSETIRNLGPIDSELIKNWCNQWAF